MYMFWNSLRDITGTGTCTIQVKVQELVKKTHTFCRRCHTRPLPLQVVGAGRVLAHLFLVARYKARYKRSRYRRSRYRVARYKRPVRHRPKLDSRSRRRRHTCREPGGQEWIKDAVLHLPLPQDHATMLASPYPPPLSCPPPSSASASLSVCRRPSALRTGLARPLKLWHLLLSHKTFTPRTSQLRDPAAYGFYPCDRL